MATEEEPFVRVGILGPIAAWRGEVPLDLGAPKQRAVLAMLLIGVNRVVSLDRLIDTFWGDQPTQAATGGLQVYVSNLRRLFEPEKPPRSRVGVIVTQPPGYRLRLDPEGLDAARFETFATVGHRLLASGRPTAARAALDEGLRLWRGAALAEFPFDSFAATEATRLEELKFLAQEDCLQARLALGDHAASVAALEALVSERPLREHPWSMLMVALYRCGRQGDALQAFSRARRVLIDELGVEPDVELRQVEYEVLSQSPNLLWQPSPEGTAVEVTTTAAPQWAAEPVEAVTMVGRSASLKALENALRDTTAGHGGVGLISGEPGIGKTRLAEEFARRASAGGANVVWGRGHEGEGAPPFWPWVQILEALTKEAKLDTVRTALYGGGAAIVSLIPKLSNMVGELAPLPPSDAATARFNLFEAVVGFLSVMADSSPLVVILDDLHWADLPSLELTRFVADRLQDTTVFLLTTFRDIDPRPGEDLIDTLGSLARLPGLLRIPLRGLTEPQVAAFLTQASGGSYGQGLAPAVFAGTDGNPFFVGEIARLLVAEGTLGDQPRDTLPVPPGVRDVIRRRLLRLPEATKAMLAVAAVTGREFPLPLVARVAGVDAERAFELIDSALATGVIAEDRDSIGSYRFDHALTRDAVYDEIAARRRSRLHGKIGAAIEDLDSGRSAASALAYHYYEAAAVVGPEKGIVAALAAAEQAQAALAYEVAEEHLRRALHLVHILPPDRPRAKRELAVQHRLASLMSMIRGFMPTRRWPPGPSAGCWQQRSTIPSRSCARFGACSFCRRPAPTPAPRRP
ncbi:MAG: AAA family ATPase [Actinomycetota bacterium]|nr:AAA family ATPase [Actinomycetota bacterium]MDQ6947121.1 AAA family ATPase [Actinomycetota bacterium]